MLGHYPGVSQTLCGCHLPSLTSFSDRVEVPHNYNSASRGQARDVCVDLRGGLKLPLTSPKREMSIVDVYLLTGFDQVEPHPLDYP